MAISTVGVYLYQGSTSSSESMTKLLDVKDYPDMLKEPELIDTTTMTDKATTGIPGLQTQGVLPFTANYDSTTFDAVAAKAGSASTPNYYELRFGDESGSAGVFEWQGRHTMGLTGKGVNDVVDMVVYVIPSSEIKKKPAPGSMG